MNIMSEENVTAVEFLADIAKTIQTIATNLQENRLDRRTIIGLLRDYSARAESDGRLINAARQDSHCVNRGLFLAHCHMELISWLGNNNYTIRSTSVKWYSWKKLYTKYRLPLFSIQSQTTELQSQLKNIERIADLVWADLQANNVRPALTIVVVFF